MHTRVDQILQIAQRVIGGDITVYMCSGVPRGVLRVLEHPHQLWHNSQFSNSVINIFTDNR